MLPSYKPGDHVLTFKWLVPKAGDVIVFKYKGGFYLKRIKQIKGKLIEVAGDNRVLSSKMKTIKKSQVIGKVILKY